MGSPAYEKDNEFTQLAHRVAEHNRGLRRGGVVERPILAERLPSVTSAAMLNPEPELSSQETARRDKLLAEFQGVPLPTVTMGAPTYTVDLLPLSRPGLPDFTKVTSIDLVKGCVVIDGLEFDIEDDIRVNDLRMFCVETATAAITRKVAEAVMRFRIEVKHEGQEADASVQSPTPTDGEGEETESSETPHPELDVPTPTASRGGKRVVKPRKRRKQSV